MKNLIILLLVFFCTNCMAQSSFKRMPKPVQTYRKTNSLSTDNNANKAFSAFRFTGPIAGYLYPQNQVVTGLGYGWQRLHFVDSTQRYYTDFSISAVAYAGGTVAPTLHPNNIVSIGISLGVLNQLVMIGPAYNLPVHGSAMGSIGVVFNISVPLN